MLKLVFKWFLASLIMPIFVLLFGRFLNLYVVVFFWPSSMALLSLGAKENEFLVVAYVWASAVGLNVLLYVLIGILLHSTINYFKS